MRFGIISSSYPATPDDSSNAGVFVRDFARKLAAAGHQVVVVTPQPADLSNDKFAVVSFPWPGQETSLTHIDAHRPTNVIRLGAMMTSGVWACLREFRARRVEHVLAMWALPSGLLARVARTVLGVPYSVWALGSDIWRADDYPLGNRALHQVLAGAAHLYADGLGLASDVERISGRRCAFLPTSRELPAVPGPAQRTDRPTYLCVARFHPHKGVDVLIDAIGLLPPSVRAEMCVRVFGAGPEEPRLRARALELGVEGCLRIEGPIGRDRLAQMLRATRCLVIPSRLESIPLVLSDAAQAGCPVLATDAGDMGALVRQFRVGEAVASGSAKELAAGLLRFHRQEVPIDADGLRNLADHLSLDRSVAHVVKDAAPRSPSRLRLEAGAPPPRWHVDRDPSRRTRKAEKLGHIVTELTHGIRGRALDIGCGAGYVTRRLAEMGWSLVSVDVNDFRTTATGLFCLGDGEALPFTSASFSLVVSNQVIEHVGDAAAHLREISRVLAPDGVAYLATPNRLWPFEPHYKLPFLAWLPRRLGDAYVRAARRGPEFDVRLLTRWRLVALATEAGLLSQDLTVEAVAGTGEVEGSRLAAAAGSLPDDVLRSLAPLMPTFVLALRPAP